MSILLLLLLLEDAKLDVNWSEGMLMVCNAVAEPVEVSTRSLAVFCRLIQYVHPCAPLQVSLSALVVACLVNGPIELVDGVVHGVCRLSDWTDTGQRMNVSVDILGRSRWKARGKGPCCTNATACRMIENTCGHI